MVKTMITSCDRDNSTTFGLPDSVKVTLVSSFGLASACHVAMYAWQEVALYGGVSTGETRPWGAHLALSQPFFVTP